MFSEKMRFDSWWRHLIFERSFLWTALSGFAILPWCKFSCIEPNDSRIMQIYVISPSGLLNTLHNCQKCDRVWADKAEVWTWRFEEFLSLFWEGQYKDSPRIFFLVQRQIFSGEIICLSLTNTSFDTYLYELILLLSFIDSWKKFFHESNSNVNRC